MPAPTQPPLGHVPGWNELLCHKQHLAVDLGPDQKSAPGNVSRHRNDGIREANSLCQLTGPLAHPPTWPSSTPALQALAKHRCSWPCLAGPPSSTGSWHGQASARLLGANAIVWPGGRALPGDPADRRLQGTVEGEREMMKGCRAKEGEQSGAVLHCSNPDTHQWTG